MFRFINKSILIGLGREAVCNYILQGKPAPNSDAELHEFLLTILTEREIEIYGKVSWLDEAVQEVTLWMLSAEPMRSWYGSCELGKFIIDAQNEALAS